MAASSGQKDHYGVLGVARDADPEIIAAAWRVLVKRFHPDTARMPKAIAAAKFRAVQEAYETLSDLARRAAYDRELAQCEVAARTQQAPPSQPPRQAPPQQPAPAPEPRPFRPRGSSRITWAERLIVSAGLLAIGFIVVSIWLGGPGNRGTARRGARGGVVCLGNR